LIAIEIHGIGVRVDRGVMLFTYFACRMVGATWFDPGGYVGEVMCPADSRLLVVWLVAVRVGKHSASWLVWMWLEVQGTGAS
jgi:hypothetical protein